jgi:hypothetical protein
MKSHTIGKGWEGKVHRVVALLSRAAWAKANLGPDGRPRKKHRPYRIPEEASELVRVMGLRDRREAEYQAKSIMEDLRRRGVEIDASE